MNQPISEATIKEPTVIRLHIDIIEESKRHTSAMARTDNGVNTALWTGRFWNDEERLKEPAKMLEDEHEDNAAEFRSTALGDEILRGDETELMVVWN